MKVLQVVQTPQRRGAEVFAYQLNRALETRGVETRTVYLHAHRGPAALPLQSTDRVLMPDGLSLVHRIPPGVSPAAIRKLRRYIAEFDPDVVQLNGGATVKYGALASYFDSHRRRALIYRNIGNPADWVRTRLQHLFYRNVVMPRIDGVVGVSDVTLRAVEGKWKLGVPRTRIPRGVDPELLIPAVSREELRRRMSTPLRSEVIVYLGSLSVEKRPDRFLRVIARLRTNLSSVRAWVIGDGPMRTELEAMAHSLGIADSTVFIGGTDDVASYLKAADLLLLTSDTEGIPGVVLEAGVLGLAVVATRVGGVGECVLEGETGLLANAGDEQALADAARVLLLDAPRRESMGKKASEWIPERFGIARVAVQYQDFYLRVLNLKRARGAKQEAVTFEAN